jgi:ferredoxin
MEKVEITFIGESRGPLEVDKGSALADVLDRADSPVFFGCKSGNCGTCLVEINEAAFAQLPPPNETEKEILESMAADKPFARLACQLEALSNLQLRYLN